VNPETVCLKCHGQMNFTVMGLPGPWQEVGEQMGNDCLVCHANIRTNRHNVSYLNAEAIEGTRLVSHHLPLSAASLAGHAGRHAGLGQGPADPFGAALRQAGRRREPLRILP